VAAEQGLAVAPVDSAPVPALRLSSAPEVPGAADLRAAAAGDAPARRAHRRLRRRGRHAPAAGSAAAAGGGRLRHALRVAVQTFRLQLASEARGDAAAAGGAPRADWRPVAVSPRGAELRDLVLARCGSLGR
jgi:hypothetical protein